jgi:K+-transporting ATPase ATPase A chain
MLIGRFLMIIPLLAMAGNLARKKTIPDSAGTLATDTSTFAMMLAGVVVVVGAIEYFPALALGPVVDHLHQMAGMLF